MSLSNALPVRINANTDESDVKDPPRLSQESSKSPNRTVVPDSEGEEDSDDSFEDVVWVKPSSLPAPVKEEKSKKKRDLPISTKPETPKYNFSLDALVAQREKDDAREQAFERIQAKIFEASDDHVTDLPGAPTSQGVIDAAVGGEHGEKLTAMLNRREAWRVEYTWYFFGQDGQPNRNNPFPTTQLNGWSVLLKGIT